MARSRRKVKHHPVRLGWGQVRRFFSAIAQFLWSILSLIGYLNPLRYIPIPTWRLGGSSNFTIDPVDGSVVHRPSLWERIGQAFRTDAVNKRRLLEWVQSQIPSLKVSNLSACWSDGVALCALIDAVCPGSCPRYDLLKPTHKVNNCRLGLKLATKCLRIPQTIITAEELALNGQHREPKLCQLLSLVKWASAQKQQSQVSESPSPWDTGQPRTPHSATESLGLGLLGIQRNCTVKGSGLVVGIIDKRSKFDIFAPPHELLDLQIEIRGPKGEACNERIMSLFPSRNNAVSTPVHECVGEDKAVALWQSGTSKLLGNSGPIQVVHRKETPQSVEQISDALKIPFDYKCIGEGQIQVSYIPRSEGTYRVEVKWHGQHVKGSPFSVTVADTIDNLNKQTKGKMRQQRVSFDRGPPPPQPPPPEEKLPEVVFEGLGPDSPNSDESPETPCVGVTAAVLNRTSKVQRSISRTGLLNNKLAKQATVTRRRILKRVITSGGQEIVIQMAPPTPSPSREGSEESEPYYPDGSPKEATKEKKKDKKTHKKESSRSFDFEIAYDSDTSYTSSGNSRPVSPSPPRPYGAMDAKELNVFVNNMLEALLQDVFRIVERKKREASLNRVGLRPNDLKLNIHRPLSHTSSAPLAVSGATSGSLNLPNFDVKFKCSPFSDGHEAPRKSNTYRSDSEESEQSMMNGHSKLCSTKSSPVGLLQRRLEKIDRDMMNSEADDKGNLPEDKSDDQQVLRKGSKSFDTSNINTVSRPEKKHAELFMSDTDSSLTSVLETDSDSLKQNLRKKIRAVQQVDTRKKENSPTSPPQVTVRTQINENRMRVVHEKQDKKLETPKEQDTLEQADSRKSSQEKRKEAVARTNSFPVSGEEKKAKTAPPLEHSETLPDQTADSTTEHVSLNAVRGQYSMEARASPPCVTQKNISQTSSLSSCMSLENFNYALEAHMQDESMLNKLDSWSGLRLSTSLPSLSKNWTAFEIDEDGTTLTIEEMEALSVAAQHRPKRVTLGASDLNDSLHEFNTFDPNREPDFALEALQKHRSSVNKKSQNDNSPQKENAFEGSMETLAIEMPSPLCPSPMVSPFSSPANSCINSRRNSISRPEVPFGLHKVSEESSFEAEPFPSNEKENRPPYNSAADNRLFIPGQTVGVWEMRPLKSANSDNIVDTLKLPTLQRESPVGHMGIRMPKATVDRCSQVTYDEIKTETGWKRPSQYVKPRPHIVRENPVELTSSLESSGSDPQAGNVYNNQRNMLPRIVCDLEGGNAQADVNDERHAQGARAVQDGGRNHLHPHGEVLGADGLQQPQRQSTIDTVDSGIVDDNHSVSPRPSAPTSPGLPRGIPVRPRFIDGHRAVTRSRYRGKIPLDPKLVSAGSPTTDDERVFSSPSRHKSWSALQYSRSNSRTKRNRLPSREESHSVSDSDGKQSGRRRSGYRSGGCYKRRVTFSRRVMMYRRSSSRSSRNSRSREETAKERSHLLDQSSEAGRSDATMSANAPHGSTKATQRRQLYTQNMWESQPSRCSVGTSDSEEFSSSLSLPMAVSTPKAVNPACPTIQLEPAAFDYGTVAKREETSRGSSGVVSDISNGMTKEVNPHCLSPKSFFRTVQPNKNKTPKKPKVPSEKKRKEGKDKASTNETHGSIDSFDGFGVSHITRKQLLEELEMFSGLTNTEKSTPDNSSFRPIAPGPQTEPAGMSDTVPQHTNSESLVTQQSTNNNSAEQLFHMDTLYESDSSAEVARLTAQNSPVDRHSKDPNANIVLDQQTKDSQPVELPKLHIINRSLETNDDSVFLAGGQPGLDSAGTDRDAIWDPLCLMPETPEQPVDNSDHDVAHVDLEALFMDDFGSELSEAQPSDSYYPEQTGRVPDPFRCRASGSGLRFGKVGLKNNFQVVTKTGGNGCLNVSITGPRPRTVKETSVTYTGDDVYEVFYEVTQPGYYIINVKWSDYNIPESPFICKVTY